MVYKKCAGSCRLAYCVCSGENVLKIIKDCAFWGINGMMIKAGGFAECSDQKKAMQKELTAFAHNTGKSVIADVSVILSKQKMTQNIRPFRRRGTHKWIIHYLPSPVLPEHLLL